MSTQPEPNDPFGVIRRNQLAKSTKKSRFNPRILFIIIGAIVVIGLIIGVLIHKPAKKSEKQQATTQSQTQQKTDQNKSSSTSSDTNSTDSKSSSSTSTTPKTSTPAAPASATPTEDAVAIGSVLQSTYSAGAPATANTCNKAVSGYSYSIDDQQTASAKVTVITQSGAGGNTIGVIMAKSGTSWAISSVNCN